MKRKEFLNKVAMKKPKLLILLCLVMMFYFNTNEIQAKQQVKYKLVDSSSHEEILRQIKEYDSSKQKQETTETDNVFSSASTYNENNIEKVAKAHEEKSNDAGQLFKDKVMYYYDMIPVNVRNSIEADGWQIIVTDEDLQSKYAFNAPALATTDYQTKTIYIANKKFAVKSVTHEVGHVVDFKLGSISWTQSFHDAFIAETASFNTFWNTDFQNTDTQTEYFAESFETYILKPDKLKQYCPATYELLANYISQL